MMALDLYTGGGEVLAGAWPFPLTMVATEPWPPSINPATRLLHPLGAVVVATSDEPPLPFGDNAFDLVTSPPVRRMSGGTNSPPSSNPAGHTSPSTSASFNCALCANTSLGRNPEIGKSAVNSTSTPFGHLRHEEIKGGFFDVGAVVYFLRKLSWVVPGFSVTEYHDTLRALHNQIKSDGSFVTHSSRLLIEARKPQ